MNDAGRAMFAHLDEEMASFDAPFERLVYDEDERVVAIVGQGGAIYAAYLTRVVVEEAVSVIHWALVDSANETSDCAMRADGRASL